MADAGLNTLHIDPRNAQVFDPVTGDDFQNLVDSIRSLGLINPITVTPTGMIVAGEQRYRAAMAAGLDTVPVIVVRYEDTDPVITLIRIDENMRRRTLKPSEMAKAVRAWNDATGRKQGRHTSSTSVVDEAPDHLVGRDGEPLSAMATAMYSRIADLIKPLADKLDAQEIGVVVAYQLAQLTAQEQEIVDAGTDVAAMTGAGAKALKDEIVRLRGENKELHERLETTAEGQTAFNVYDAALLGLEERERQRMEEIESEKEQEVLERTRDLERDKAILGAERDAEYRKRQRLEQERSYYKVNAFHLGVEQFRTIIGYDPVEYFNTITAANDPEVWAAVVTDISTIHSIHVWLSGLLQHYRELIESEAGGTVGGIRRVQ